VFRASGEGGGGECRIGTKGVLKKRRDRKEAREKRAIRFHGDLRKTERYLPERARKGERHRGGGKKTEKV